MERITLDTIVEKKIKEMEKTRKANNRALLKNPRFYVVSVTIVPILLPIVLIVTMLCNAFEGLATFFGWIHDGLSDLMAPVRNWIEAGQKRA